VDAARVLFRGSSEKAILRKNQPTEKATSSLSMLNWTMKKVKTRINYVMKI